MHFLQFFTCLLVIACSGCNSANPDHADEPAFKGMELYSWKPTDGDWHFSLLPGTNRQKSVSEVTKPEYTIVGVDHLKQKLAVLVKGESVFWRNLAEEPVPRELLIELTEFCQRLDVHLEEIKGEND